MKTRSKRFLDARDIPWEQASEGIRRKIMAYDGQMMLVYVEFEKGAIASQHEHYHSQGTQVISGKFEVTVDGESKVLSAGDGFYIEPDVRHGAVCLEAGVLLDVFSPHRADFLTK